MERTSSSNKSLLFLSVFFLIYGISMNTSAQGIIDLPRTGQSISYYPGDDGDIQAGVPWPEPRFTDHGDGTVTDNLTGLMWAENGNLPGGKILWESALDYVAGMNSGTHSNFGHRDWRLPNIIELESIVNVGEDVSAIWLNNHGFQNVGESGSWLNYFSSNTWSFPTEWSRILIYGNNIGGGHYTVGRFVWPVRGTASGIAQLWKTGQTISYYPGDDGDLEKGIAWPDPRFRDNGDGTVTDKLTGLIWLKDAKCFEPLSWPGSLDKIREFNLYPSGFQCKYFTALFNDWRLPNRKELLSLSDFSNYASALPDGHPFVNVPNGQFSYWSSTTDKVYQTAYFWSSYTGGLGDMQKPKSPSSDIYIWPVRGGTISERALTPSILTGPTLGTTGSTYNYSSGGSNSNLGHPVEYQFDWGDGTFSNWSSASNASKAWSSTKEYPIRARARCASHNSFVSGWSQELLVNITVENVSIPSSLSGPTSGATGTNYSYTIGGSSTTLGHQVQYLFDWGNGTTSGWLPAGTSNTLNAWASSGVYYLKVKARCAIDTQVESKWSSELSVTITGPSESVTIPLKPQGPVDGVQGTSDTYTTGGASSNFGHPVEYQFDWKGNGSDLSSWGLTTQSKTWTVGGTYNVRARGRCANHNSVVSDWSEGLLVNIISTDGPDLTGSWTTSLTQTCRIIGKNQRCSLKGIFTVSNIGNRDASSTQVKCYLSNNATYEAGDTQLKSVATGKLKPGKGKAINVNLNLATNQTATGKYIIALIDKDNLVVEIDETNNTITYGPIP
jgi:hypothetical protein